MQPLFLPAVVLLSSFIVSLIGLTIYSLLHDQKHQLKQTSLHTDNHEDTASDKAAVIIHNAQVEAKRILAEAELAGIRAVANKKVNTAELEKTYENDLTTLSVQTLEELKRASTEINRRYDQFVTESENIIAHHISQNQQRLDQHIIQAISSNESAFQAFLATQQKKIEQAFTNQISQVESLVSAYQNKRLKLVDAQVVELISQTTKITLRRTLDLKQHTEIILEALEEAKSAGFFDNDTNKSTQ